jgi:SAM-dependent methyltransferase
MATHVQPIHAPLPSGIQPSRSVAPDSAGVAHQLELLALDQVRSWGWDNMLFLEFGDGWAAEEAWRRRRTRGHVVALDRSAGAIERACRLRGVAGQVEFATWNGRHLGDGGERFDQIISNFVFRQSPDPEALAREMLRVLKPLGELYALEPDASAGETRTLLTLSGFMEVEDLARGVGIESAVVIHARARPTR